MGSSEPTANESLVVVTPDMEASGLDALREANLLEPSYLVRSIYMAMEYQRLSGGINSAPAATSSRK